MEDVTYKSMSHAMKMKGFVEDIQGWTRKFTFISLKGTQLFIGHRIEKKIGILTPIKFQDLDEWIKYFDRI